MWLLVHPGSFSVLLLTYYPAAINLLNSLPKGFYVHPTISQPTLKEPTPASLKCNLDQVSIIFALVQPAYLRLCPAFASAN